MHYITAVKYTSLYYVSLLTVRVIKHEYTLGIMFDRYEDSSANLNNFFQKLGYILHIARKTDLIGSVEGCLCKVETIHGD